MTEQPTTAAGPPSVTLEQIESRLQRALNAEPVDSDLLWATLADVRRSLALPTRQQDGSALRTCRICGHDYGIHNPDCSAIHPKCGCPRFERSTAALPPSAPESE